MATGMQVWSVTPTNNATADSNVNWAEGMAPSQVNDSSRAVMASAAKWVLDNNGVSLITSGTTSALTVATNQVEGALTSGYTLQATLGTAISTNATLVVDGLAATNIYTGLSTGFQPAAGQFNANQIVSFVYTTGIGATPVAGWVVSAASPGLNPILTNASASLASSVNLTTGSYTDGPSVSVGSSGTWYVCGTVTYLSGGSGVFLKLWDGTNLISSTALSVSSGDFPASLCGVISAPAGNLRISGELSGAGSAGGFIASANSVGNASTIYAVRIG